MDRYNRRSKEELIREIESLKREKNVILMTQRVALRETEDRYRRMVETANEGIWVLDAKGMTTFVNNKMGVLLGYHPEEMLGRHVFDFMDEEARSVAEEKLVRRKQGIKEQFDFCFRSKDGHEVWTILSTNPIYDHENRYAGALAMLTDITDRKRAEDALKASEARYRAMIDAFNGFSFICSSDQRLEFLNEKLKQHLGRDATGEHCYNALHGLFSGCPNCVNGEGSDESVRWEMQSPGDNSWYEVANSPLCNSDGTKSKHGLITDVTRLKRAEAELVKQTVELRQAVKLAGFGVWEWHACNDTIVVSDQLSRIAGRESLSVADSFGLAHPEDLPRLKEAVREAFDTDTLDISYRIVLKENGDVRTLRVLGEVLRDADQQPVGMCGIASDVTSA